jgi:hypothetical protein
VRACLEAEQPQVARQQHRRLRGQQRRAVGLRASDPLAPGSPGRGSRGYSTSDHQRVRVVVDRPMHGARRLDARRPGSCPCPAAKLSRLAGRQLLAQRGCTRGLRIGCASRAAGGSAQQAAIVASK